MTSAMYNSGQEQESQWDFGTIDATQHKNDPQIACQVWKCNSKTLVNDQIFRVLQVTFIQIISSLIKIVEMTIT